MRNHAVQLTAEDRSTAQMPGGNCSMDPGFPPPDSQLDPRWNPAQPSPRTSGAGDTNFISETDGAAHHDLDAGPTLATLSVEPPHSLVTAQSRKRKRDPKTLAAAKSLVSLATAGSTAEGGETDSEREY